MAVSPGVAFDNAASSIQGRFDSPGDYTVHLEIKDSHGNKAEFPLQLRVASKLEMIVLQFSPIVISEFDQTVAHMDVKGGRPPYSWEGTAVPTGQCSLKFLS